MIPRVGERVFNLILMPTIVGKNVVDLVMFIEC